MKSDPHARVFLFGSRADSHARGGDIDLLDLRRYAPQLLAAADRTVVYVERTIS